MASEAERATAPESRALRVFSRGVQLVAGAAVAVAAACLLVAFVLIVWAIVMRYAFNAAPTWVDDIAGFSLVAVVMLAAAQTLRRGEHIGVDLLVTNLSPTGRRWANAWAALATAAIAGVLVVKGWESAMFSRSIGMLTEGSLEWPTWCLMLFLPLGGVLLLLASAEALWRAIADAAPTAVPISIERDGA